MAEKPETAPAPATSDIAKIKFPKSSKMGITCSLAMGWADDSFVSIRCVFVKADKKRKEQGVEYFKHTSRPFRIMTLSTNMSNLACGFWLWLDRTDDFGIPIGLYFTIFGFKL